MLRFVAFAGDLDRAAAEEPAAAFQMVDPVLLEQVGDALGQLVDHAVLARHHGPEVERRRRLDAVRRQAVLRLGELLRTLEQRLGRDAADIEAGAAQGPALLGDGHAHAELGAADRTDIAAGPGADDDDVVGGGVGH